ncbi:hypothetical protein PG985_016036 [Apiospora marii]|uniref:uncharacterized protein n=1 Tax=Apiospora marii TaxID=335849 RepID=UPI003130A8CA
MAYQQTQNPYPQFGGGGSGVSPQHQLPPSPAESSPTTYGKWETIARRLQQPALTHQPPPSYQQQQQEQQPQPPMQQQQSWYPPPTGHAAEGIARAHQWVATTNPGPPPPPSLVVSPLSTTAGPPGAIGQPTSLLSYQTLPPRPEKRRRKVCGVERAHFLVIVAVALLLLVSGIATGVGVGLALGGGGKSGKSTNPS